jgi:hypothetical protein
MKQLAGYLTQFAREINRNTLLSITLYTAVFVSLNYYFNLEKTILRSGPGLLSFTCFFVLYLLVFGGSYYITFHFNRSKPATLSYYHHQADHHRPGIPFIYLLLLVTSFFAWRVSSGSATNFILESYDSPWLRYWLFILTPAFKFSVLMLMIELIRRRGNYKESVSGLRKQNPSLKPFVLLLIYFAPVILIIGSQPDFLNTYPRLKVIDKVLPFNYQSWITDLIFELSYAFDFLTAEVFFRGLLVLAFVKYAGSAAILPMASFYCAIHFGKPPLECISSYAGAMILGVIAYRTGSIIGGLFLHLGIGWLMELIALLYSN